MRRLIVAVLLLGACKLPPPPLKEGKCVTDAYRNGNVSQQTCTYAGYLWTCVISGDSHCTRGPEVVGERAK